MTNDQQRTLRFRNVLAYGLGDVYGSGAFVLIGLLFLFFLTDYVGLTPALAGLVFAIGKVLDAVTDPLMGFISDRTRSRFGRRRVYFLIGIVPVALSFTLLWVPIQGWSQAALFAYYSGAYALFSLVFTMVIVPFVALNAEMSRDVDERTRLSGARMICAQVANLAAGTIPGILLGIQLGNRGTNFLLVGVVFGIVFALPWVFVFLGTWELPQGPERSPAPGRATRDRLRSYAQRVFLVLKNRSFRIHIGMYVTAYSAIDLLMAVFLYFLNYYLGEEGWYTYSIGTLLIVEIAFVPVFVRFANEHGKAAAYRVGVGVWILGLALAFFLIRPGVPLFAMMIIAGVIGAGMAAGVLVPWANLPSIIDIDEMVSGERRAGVYSGFMTLIRKFIQGAIVVPLIGVVLEWIGFRANVAQSAATAEGIRLLFILGQAGFLITGFLVSTIYPVRPKILRAIQDEIARINQGGKKADVTPVTRELCERVTGYRYEELFPQAE
ncbi:MAG: MFS transporter [Spirochaetota bacterium]